MGKVGVMPASMNGRHAPSQLNLSKLIARLKPGAVAAAAASLVQTEATGGRRLDGGGGMGTGRQSAGMQAMTAAGLMAGAARVVKPGDW